jgi:hypothetical protein
MLVVSCLSSVGDGVHLAFWFSLSRSTKYHTRPNLDAEIGSPLGITSLRLPPFGSSRPNNSRLSSVESTWEVESEIYRNAFSVFIKDESQYLTIYFGDIRGILDIFSIKAMCLITSATSSTNSVASEHSCSNAPFVLATIY